KPSTFRCQIGCSMERRRQSLQILFTSFRHFSVIGRSASANKSRVKSDSSNGKASKETRTLSIKVLRDRCAIDHLVGGSIPNRGREDKALNPNYSPPCSYLLL